MLSNTLNTNEIKDRAGVEIEFTRISSADRKTEFKAITETPMFPNRLIISHTEVGANFLKRRRSLVSFRKTVQGVSLAPVPIIANFMLETPIGDLSAYDEPKNVVAQMLSFCASLGATTTILYDCTGNGAVCLVQGDI